jgi:hypothetical protein
MNQKIQLGEIVVDVGQKNIKHLYLSVYPPEGKVRISAIRTDNVKFFEDFTFW